MGLLAATASCCALIGLTSAIGSASAIGETEAPVSAPPRLLLRNFAIFRTAPEQLPPDIATDYAEQISAGGPLGGRGFNLALTQKAALPDTEASLWVVPGRTDLLVIDDIGGHAAALSTIRQALRRGLGLWTGVPKTAEPHLMRVAGVVPDGVSAVKVTKESAAIVRNNAFTLTLGVGRGQEGPWQNRNWVFLHGVPTAS